jgi:hypothetical protein
LCFLHAVARTATVQMNKQRNLNFFKFSVFMMQVVILAGTKGLRRWFTCLENNSTEICVTENLCFTLEFKVLLNARERCLF